MQAIKHSLGSGGGTEQKPVAECGVQNPQNFFNTFCQNSFCVNHFIKNLALVNTSLTSVGRLFVSSFILHLKLQKI